MSGVKRMEVGKVTQSKPKGSNLRSALVSAMTSITTAKAKQPLKKGVGK